MKPKNFCALITGILLGPLAQASDIISFLASTPLAPTGSAKTVQLQGFNPGLGTLTAVKLTYVGQIQQTGLAENTGAAPTMGYTLSGTANLSLAKSPGGPALFASPAGTFTFSQAGSINSSFDGTFDFGGTSGLTFLIHDTVWSAPAAYLDSDLASYLTAGLINFSSLGTSTGGITINSGNGAGGLLTKASATLQVEYTYTQIPEPATNAAWLGLAVLGAAVLRRRACLAT